MGSVMNGVVKQAKEAVDKIIPRAGLAFQATLDQGAVYRRQRHQRTHLNVKTWSVSQRSMAPRFSSISILPRRRCENSRKRAGDLDEAARRVVPYQLCRWFGRPPIGNTKPTRSV